MNKSEKPVSQDSADDWFLLALQQIKQGTHGGINRFMGGRDMARSAYVDWCAAVAGEVIGLQ